MEQGAAVNFHSLRAKFQESQTKERRPPVPERPKRLPATVVRCGPQFAFNKPTITPTEDKNVICSKNTVRDDHRRPISVPVNTLHTSTPTPVALPASNPMAKVPFKDRHLPLVLPIPFSSEPKHHSPPKGVSSPVRGKKKTMMMPFKSTITSKFSKGNLENGEHSSSMEKSQVENGFSHNGYSSNPGSVNPSPEKPGTPPPVDAIEGSSTDGYASHTSHQRVLSTLERAKRKFSPKQLLEYAKPKSFHSRNSSPSTSPPPPPADYENMITEQHSSVPPPERMLPPVPPHAPPSPFNSNGIGISLKYATVNRDKGCVLDRPTLIPPVNLLPDLQSLGPRPVKPPRPPLVDLTPFTITNEFEQNALITVNSSSAAEDVNLDQHVLRAPEFPDFDPSESVHSAPSAFDAANASVPAVATETFGVVELPPPDLVDFGCVGPRDPHTTEQVAPEAPAPPALPPWMDSQPSLDEGTDEILDCALRSTQATDSSVTSEHAVDQNVRKADDYYDHGDNIYEDVASVAKFHFNQNSRKRKAAPKNPYGSPPLNELTRKTGRSIAPWSKEAGERMTLTRRHSVRKERGSPESHEQKEQKKKEKQHQEKEKKEQKERQKRENEMKKKFKVTGLEEPMYHAKVMVTSKVRKHDLPVNCGDTVSIIRTTSCPKGKWLARDATHRYGYVSLKSLELNIKEMLELGKRASQTAGLATNEGDTISLGSRSSTQNPTHTSSFTDDSEEWTFEEETLSPTTDMSQCRSMSMPDMFASDCHMHPTQVDVTESVTARTRHDALQKLAIFFEQSKGSFDDPSNGEATPTNTENRDFLCGIEEPPYLEQQGEDFDFADVELLPPPELYADT